MKINSPSWNNFQNFFQTHHDLKKTISAMNKATNAIMGKKFYSNETKKIWRVINAYEKGNFISRTFEVWVEDISTDLKFWSWTRFTYGWKHPRMMVPVSVLEEKFEKGILEVIEYEL